MDEQRIAGIRAAAQQWGDNYALLTGKQVIALLDTLAARDAELARIRKAISSVEWLENEICTSDSTRYICPFCLHYSASNAHNPAGHYPDCPIARRRSGEGDGAGDGIDWKASYHEAHAEANAWKELLDYRTAEAERLREALEPFAAIDTGETDCPDHFTQEETLTTGSIRRARAALGAREALTPVCVWPQCDCDRNLEGSPCRQGWPKTKNLPTG